MSCRLLALASVIFTIAFGTEISAQQLAIYGLQSWTTHEDLPNPTGYGVFAQSSLYSKLQFRVDYSFSKDTDNFVATIARGWGLVPQDDTLTDTWDQFATVKHGEIAVLISPLKPSFITPSFGAGIGFSTFHWSISGRKSAFTKSAESNFRLTFAILADLEVSHPQMGPLVLHLTFHEQLNPEPLGQCVDCPNYFGETISSAVFAVALALKL